jgi:hypothetical protein
MTTRNTGLRDAARSLIDCMNRETRLARVGAVRELAEAADAKQKAFDAFQTIRQSPDFCEISEEEDRQALADLLVAANENALVLEAVTVTLSDTAKRLHALLASMADPGTYGRFGADARHVPAVRINAIA